jgi:ATP-dependent DNA helicase RecG
MHLETPVLELKGVGAEVAKKLKTLSIKTVGDLIDYYPRRYDDYSHVTSIARLRPGMTTIKAGITSVSSRYARRGMHITEAIASDDNGSTRLVWFNQPYRAASIKRGAEYFISGNYELSYQRFSMINPSVELVSSFPLNTARIVPVYRLTKGITSRQIRSFVKQVVRLIRVQPETLPNWIVKDHKLLFRAEAIEAMHFPNSASQLEAAKKRLGFEEVFELVLASLLNKQENQREHSLKIPFNVGLARDFVAHLPFKLTDEQRKTIWQIYQDLENHHPMNRLIEGDVGSGKTVVAAMAALMPIEQKYQVAFMAPTEILARQHAETVHKLLKPLSIENTVVLLAGSMKRAEKTRAHKAIASGEAKFIIGTHALTQEKVDMHKLALVIIDEQHRFGVEQRKNLMAKAGHAAHVLSLTATPIPRSLALTLYGELSISIIAAKPPGRRPIATKIVSPNSRAQLYKKIKKELAAGRQMFVVCPLISDSEVSQVSSAEKVFEQFCKKDFKELRVGLLHGRMKEEEKDKAMESFVNHKLDILVSTTIIEVGVDVSNASIMLIENAERFGLAQIHQLRGRVGRGEHQGYCYLMMSDSSVPSARLRALESSNDGFKLAELDLRLRGPGAIYGRVQHGQLDLRIANLSDTKLIASAREAAQHLVDKRENLVQYKHLAERVNHLRTVTNLN